MFNRINLRVLGLAILVVAPGFASAQVAFFDQRSVFAQVATSIGKTPKGVEDFEGSNLAPGSVLGMPDPLTWGVANGPYTNGLTGLDNLTVQSNLGGANSAVLNPRGVDGLVAVSVGFAGAASDIILANFFVDSLDLIFSGSKTAIGGNALSLAPAGQVRIDVYDQFNGLIGTGFSAGTVDGSTFFGVISPVAIGQLNIFSVGGGAEGMDNIEAWEAVPEPATMAALGLGAVALLKRRRKS